MPMNDAMNDAMLSCHRTSHSPRRQCLGQQLNATSQLSDGGTIASQSNREEEHRRLHTAPPPTRQTTPCLSSQMGAPGNATMLSCHRTSHSPRRQCLGQQLNATSQLSDGGTIASQSNREEEHRRLHTAPPPTRQTTPCLSSQMGAPGNATMLSCHRTSHSPRRQCLGQQLNATSQLSDGGTASQSNREEEHRRLHTAPPPTRH